MLLFGGRSQVQVMAVLSETIAELIRSPQNRGCLILLSTTNTNYESMTFRSCRFEMSEKLPQGVYVCACTHVEDGRKHGRSRVSRVTYVGTPRLWLIDILSQLLLLSGSGLMLHA